MAEEPKKLKRFLARMGVRRVSHRRAVPAKTIIGDLKALARSLKRTWPTKRKPKPKEK